MRAKSKILNNNTAPSLQALYGRIQQLPSLSHSTLRIMNESYSSGLDMRVMEQALSQDVGLCGKVLQLANSPLYGLNRRVDTLRSACMIVGINSIHNLVMATELSRVLIGKRTPSQELVDLWKHSLSTALCAAELAPTRNVDGGAAYVAGLLHDVGAVVLESEFPFLTHKVREHEKKNSCSKSEAEMIVFGYTHEVVGEMLANSWQLPESVVGVVKNHHRPYGSVASNLLNLVVVANCVSALIGYGTEKQDKKICIARVIEDGRLTPSEMLVLREKVVKEIEKIQRVC